MFYTLFSFSKLTPSPQPHSNFVSLNAKNTKILDINVIESLKEKFTKEKQKKIKKNKSKNLTPSSSKTIFHTLITLKRYILGTPNYSKKLFKNKVVLNFKKNQKKPKYQKK